MATITLSNAAYNNAKFYAERQNLSVDEFVVMLVMCVVIVVVVILKCVFIKMMMMIIMMYITHIT